jgi:hypothetical protein
MIRSVLYAGLFLTLLLLTGCATLDGNNVTKTYVKVISIPEYLLEPCGATEPISKNDYLSLSPSEKTTYLSKHIVELYGNIKDCNNQLSAIKKFQDSSIKDVNEIYNSGQ